VAALALAGKPLPNGVSLAPDLEGTWRWLDDRVLEFRPKQDWPIGQPFHVILDKAVLAPQVRLKKYGFEFSTANFAAQAAAPLTLEPIAAERGFVESHSFRYHADVGRFMLVQVDRNLRSFGGYLSPRTERFIVAVPPFPPELKILSQGSLLALSGERKVAALVRDLPGVRIDIARLLPAQLQHWVSQSNGDFSNPSFYGGLGPDNLTERFVQKIPLRNLAHGQAHYESIDLGEYLHSGSEEKRGIFLLTVQGYDPRAEAAQRRAAASDETDGPDETDGLDEAGGPDEAAAAGGGMMDQRLILVACMRCC
jgi:uncharacterized protein YfaS (alpha-2-macroglobulin family)